MRNVVVLAAMLLVAAWFVAWYAWLRPVSATGTPDYLNTIIVNPGDPTPDLSHKRVETWEQICFTDGWLAVDHAFDKQQYHPSAECTIVRVLVSPEGLQGGK